MADNSERTLIFNVNDIQDHKGQEVQVGTLSAVGGIQADARHFLPPDEYWEIEVYSDRLSDLTVNDLLEFFDSSSVSGQVVIYSRTEMVADVSASLKFTEGRVGVGYFAKRESDRPIPMEIAIKISERVLADGNPRPAGRWMV
jgi:hypothetical protein